METAQQSSIPAFSPDSHSIAYWASDRTLKRIYLRGGAALTICPVATNPRGLSWGPDGIVFTQDSQILRVSATGGNPELSSLQSPTKWPMVRKGTCGLPDHPVHLESWRLEPRIMGPGLGEVVQSLKTGERKTLVSGGADGRYLSTGHLRNALGGTLIASVIPIFAACKPSVRRCPLSKASGA